MGSGKGAPEGWAAVVEEGRVLFEIGGANPESAKRALRVAGYKLPIKTKVIARDDKEVK
jgi:large subunit ribosomal protein L16